MLINAHFGNRSTVQVACEQLQLKLGNEAIIIPLLQASLYLPNDPRFAGILEGFHSNNSETSLMLYLAGHLVDMSKAVADGHYPELVDRLLARFQQPVKAFSSSGVLGNPLPANRETGEAAFAAVVKGMVGEVERLSAFLWAQRKGGLTKID